MSHDLQIQIGLVPISLPSIHSLSDVGAKRFLKEREQIAHNMELNTLFLYRAIISCIDALKQFNQ